MELAGTMDLLLLCQSQSTKFKTRPSRLSQKIMRLAHPSPVAHHLHSPKVLTQALTDMVVHHLHSQKATTRTTAMVHTTDELAVVAAAAVEVHGLAVAPLDHPPVLPLSCKT